MNKFKVLNNNHLILIFLCLISSFGCKTEEVRIENPIMDGYFADPSIVQYNDTFFIYATIDPWGDEELGVFTTTDFIHFQQKHINWPNKKQCTSPTSKGAYVWAPSVIQAPDKLFYMYVSVGSEIWAGVAQHPLGPWQNAKEDASPLIKSDLIPAYHMIDAEAFIDDDGEVYLYWGSGWNWVNGACFGVKLVNDMITFKDEPKNITPPNFFEAAVMFKRNGSYYLMYSDGKAIDHTYKIRYSTGETPFGPWEEGKNSPILQTTSDSTIIGPGHNTVFKRDDQYYILYHKIFPQNDEYVLRQLCIDSLNFDSENNIEKVISNGVIF